MPDTGFQKEPLWGVNKRKVSILRCEPDEAPEKVLRELVHTLKKIAKRRRKKSRRKK